MREKVCLLLASLALLGTERASSGMAAEASGAAPAPAGIRLIVRGDDIGSAHAANLACIEAYKKGIVRSVEIMVPCSWFLEAVKLLEEVPDLDVGVHLTLTSEWENYKWRPLTSCPSLVDRDGYFFPTIWPSERFPASMALRSQKWSIEEVEKELRAQIELARRHVPRISHLSYHMGCDSFDPRVRELCSKLAAEYKLDIDPSRSGVKYFPLRSKGETVEDRIAGFTEALQKLEPGTTYLFVEHPGLDVPEMQAIGHIGYSDVARDRALVTRTFTDEKIRKVIEERGIQLIAYKDLKR